MKVFFSLPLFSALLFPAVLSAQEAATPEAELVSSATAGLPATKPAAVRIGENRYRIGEAVADLEAGTVTVPGRTNMQAGVIELLACGPRGKLHESVLALDVESIHLQTALLLIGLEPGEPVEYFGDPSIPTGDPVVIWVEWEEDGRKVRHRGEDLVFNWYEKKPMEHIEWVFTGSRVIDGYFAADVDQQYITTYHDPFAIIDNPLPTGGDDEVYEVNKELIPERGTAVTVTIRAAEKEGGKKATRTDAVSPEEAGDSD